MKWWAKSTEICWTLNQIELLLISASTVTGCEYISAFAFLIAIPVGIAILAVGLKMCSITAGIKELTTKERKKHDRLVLLRKYKYHRSLNV